MKILKVIAVYAVLILMFELFIRFFFPEYGSLNHNFGVTGGIPFRLNSYRLRDHEFNFDKGNKFRILVLGDSITFGTQNKLDCTYPKVLEKLLNNGRSGKYQAINAGGVGGNTIYEYSYLKEKGIKFKPDYVILGFCLNDVGNCYAAEKNGIAKSPNFWNNPEGFRAAFNGKIRNKNLSLRDNLAMQLNSFRWRLRSKSYFYSFADVNLTRLMYRYGIKKYSFDIYEEKQQMLCFGIDAISEEAWQLTLNSILEIKKFLDDREIGFLLALFPYEFQLSDDIKDNFFNINKSRFKIDPQERLINFCRENRIDALDMLPYFKKTNKNIYFPLDYCHPNANGHRIAAEEIYNRLFQKIR